MLITRAAPPPRFIHLVRAGLGLMAVQRGDVPAATEQYQALNSMAGCMLQSGFICFDRLLGLLAHTMDNFDQAMTHFEEALAFCRRAGYLPELASSFCDYADVLLQRDGPGDQNKADVTGAYADRRNFPIQR